MPGFSSGRKGKIIPDPVAATPQAAQTRPGPVLPGRDMRKKIYKKLPLHKQVIIPTFMQPKSICKNCFFKLTWTLPNTN
jgi:hypothetical protein